MQNWNTQVPLVVLVVLILSAFVPVIPITLIFINSAFTVSLSELIFESRETIVYNGINIFGTIASLIGYFWAKHRAWIITLTCLYVLFFIPLITLNTANWIYDEVPYFLPFLVHGIIIVIPLYLIGFIKERKQHK